MHNLLEIINSLPEGKFWPQEPWFSAPVKAEEITS